MPSTPQVFSISICTVGYVPRLKDEIGHWETTWLPSTWASSGDVHTFRIKNLEIWVYAGNGKGVVRYPITTVNIFFADGVWLWEAKTERGGQRFKSKAEAREEAALEAEKNGTKPDEEEEERKAPRFVEDEYKMEAETRTATRNGLIQGSSLYKVVGPAVHWKRCDTVCSSLLSTTEL